MLKRILSLTTVACLSLCAYSTGPSEIRDIDAAKDYCDELPLESIEGIWLYPDDHVAVMILSEGSAFASSHSYPEYSLWVVESSDTRVRPGDKIGTLTATAKENTYKINLATESKNGLLLKPKSCLATLDKEGDSFIIKKQKSGIKGRLSLNFSRLLPGFWKIVNTGISSSGTSSNAEAPVGMVKIYPSYDGNGSSKRKVRYL